jgi:hypothetical protein
MIIANVWTTHKHNRQRNPASVHLDCRWNCLLLRCHTNCRFYFSAISNAPFDTPPSTVAFDAAGRTFTSFTQRVQHRFFKRLMAATQSVSRRRNCYFGVLATATDNSPAADSDLRYASTIFEKCTIVWEATWSSRPITPTTSETLKLYWPVAKEYTECEASGYRWSLPRQISPQQEFLAVQNYAASTGKPI